MRSPQVSIVWVGLDGDEIVFAHLGAGQKIKNLRRDPDGRWRWHWDPDFFLGPLPIGTVPAYQIIQNVKDPRDITPRMLLEMVEKLRHL